VTTRVVTPGAEHHQMCVELIGGVWERRPRLRALRFVWLSATLPYSRFARSANADTELEWHPSMEIRLRLNGDLSRIRPFGGVRDHDAVMTVSISWLV
jgi:hypothetical protein